MTKRKGRISDKERLDWLGRQKRAFGAWFGQGLFILAEFPCQSRALRKSIDVAIRRQRGEEVTCQNARN